MNGTRREHIRALVAGLATSVVLLAACVWWVYRELAFVVGSSKVTGSIAWGDAIDGVLRDQLLAFAAAVIAVHALLALLGYGLARLTRAAFPRLGVQQLASLAVLWILVFFGLVLAANASWFPASRFADEDSWLHGDWRGLAPLTVLATGLALATAAIGALAVRNAARPVLSWRRTGTATMILLTIFAFAAMQHGAYSEPAPQGDRPHVVILGIDSLRNDLSEATVDRTLTPNIDAFLAESTRFSDATSPLARTFPAWVSILTGRHPVTTNARFNLMPRDMVREGDTLADALGASGYRSVYATDEVRFANFDRSYGFDTLITPPIGASDFVVPTIGDMPLVNVVASTRPGAWLFPNIHGNRAAAVTYQPQDFIDRLERELEVTGPSLLAIHLTLSHWPYSWAGHAKPSNPAEFRPAYRQALQEVDRQFAAVLELLERRGVLDNALVVLLSDHGEALGFPSDSIVRKTGSSLEIWDSLWGHGTSVLSPHQFGVVFAMRAFGSATLPAPGGTLDWPVSLEDLRPTLQELVTGVAPRDVDGISLVPYFKGEAPASMLDDRVRFTETCFNTVKLMQGKFTESGLVSEAGIFYELVPATGRVQLRRDRLPEIMAKKQRAAISRNAILARVPSWTEDSVTYLFAERHEPLPVPLAGPPDPAAHPAASRLWESLEQRFPGEWPPRPAGTQM